MNNIQVSEKVGSVGKNAGICWVGDPAYILTNTGETIGSNWYDLGFEGVGLTLLPELKRGLYSVYIRKEDDVIKEVKVLFDEEER